MKVRKMTGNNGQIVFKFEIKKQQRFNFDSCLLIK